MKRRGFRVCLVLLFVATLCGSGYQLFLSEQRIAAESRAIVAFDDLAWATMIAIADLRGTQEAYIAGNQNVAYWGTRTSSYLSTVTTRLVDLMDMATAPLTKSSLAMVAEILDDFRQMDAQARDYKVSGQPSAVSDLIFTDSLVLVMEASDQIDLARNREQETRNQVILRERQSEIIVITASFGIGFLVVLLLAPTHTRGNEENNAISEKNLKPYSETVGTEDHLFDTAQPTEVTTMSTPDPTPEIAQNLYETAELCTDFGRSSGPQDLSALLDRAAQLFNASGIVIWISDPTGQTLRPALGYGYPNEVLIQMGPLSRDSDNATAAAYRTVQMQTIKSKNGSAGAIAVPLLTAASCIGVMAAEVQNGSENSEPMQAVAKIVASQIASLVTVNLSEEVAQAEG